MAGSSWICSVADDFRHECFLFRRLTSANSAVSWILDTGQQ